MAAPSHYQLLGVPPSASADDLRQAFRRLSKRYHPDTTTLPLAEAAAAFATLQRAYRVLSDPERRRAYDALGGLAQPQARPQAEVPVQVSPRRPLSGGEWLALLLLTMAAVFALVLGVGMAWLRGVDLIEWPSWWLEAR